MNETEVLKLLAGGTATGVLGLLLWKAMDLIRARRVDDEPNSIQVSIRDEIKDGFGRVETKIEAVHSRINGLHEMLGDVKERVARLEGEDRGILAIAQAIKDRLQ